jgi:hypothetical protein
MSTRKSCSGVSKKSGRQNSKSSESQKSREDKKKVEENTWGRGLVALYGSTRQEDGIGSFLLSDEIL